MLSYISFLYFIFQTTLQIVRVTTEQRGCGFLHDEKMSSYTAGFVGFKFKRRSHAE